MWTQSFPANRKKCVFQENIDDDNANGQKTLKLRPKNKKDSSIMHVAKASTSKSDTLLSDSVE